jgi:hypothetical protein
VNPLLARALVFLACVVAGALGSTSAAQQPGGKSKTPAPDARLPGISTSASQACKAAHTTAERLLAELEKTVPGPERAAAA